MSGPLSRRRFSSDLPLEEDNEAIQWTYVSSQKEFSQSDVPTYTSEGTVSNKRRKLYRQRKDESDLKPTPSRTCIKSVEWTEDEDLSLCQAVSIYLQQNKSEDSIGPTMENPSDVERDHPSSVVLARDVSRELQSLEISKYLAECFVPSHERRDVLARVKSSTFRRTFTAFLNSRNRCRERLLCLDSTDTCKPCNSSSGDAHLKDNWAQDAKSSPSSKPELYPETFESCVQHQSPTSQSKQNSRKKLERQSERISLNLTSKCSAELSDAQETSILQGKPISRDAESEKLQPMRRRASRLQGKLGPDGCDTPTDIEDLPINTTRQTLQDATDNSNSRNSSESGLNSNVGSERQPGAKADKQKKQLPRKQSSATITQTSLESAKTGKPERQGPEKRQEKISRRFETAELERPTSKVPVKKESKSGTPDRLAYENERRKDQTVPRQWKESTGCELEDRKATESPPQLTPSDKVPLLATVQPLKKAHTEKDKEKKSFKKFRKRFLDRCLEVQHSGLGLTARVQDHKTNTCTMSSAHSSLDEYLTMQHVQQSRKNILDACLMAQRDTS